MIRKKEGFAGQQSIVLPRKILAEAILHQPVMEWLYITDIGYYPKAQYHFRQRVHGIDQHILIYCMKGCGQAQVERKKYMLGPGSFIIIPAGSYHSYAAGEKDSWTIYWVHFKGSLSGQLVDQITGRIGGHQGVVEFQPARQGLFNDMYACLERGYGTDNLSYANVCLYHYLSSFIYGDKMNLSVSRQIDDAVELSINYMQQHLSHSPSLGEIAASVNFSPSHYSALFRRKTGFAPIEYFNHLKVQKACQFLLYTDMRIKEVADRLGIEDPYYFSRMFTKLMGVSPEQYRGNVRAKGG